MKRITNETHAALLLPYSERFSGSLCFRNQPLSYPSLSLPEMLLSSDMPLMQRYCTEYVLSLGKDTKEEWLRRVMHPLGECFMLVSRCPLCKVYIHTNDPPKVLSLASVF